MVLSIHYQPKYYFENESVASHRDGFSICFEKYRCRERAVRRAKKIPFWFFKIKILKRIYSLNFEAEILLEESRTWNLGQLEAIKRNDRMKLIKLIEEYHSEKVVKDKEEP